MYLKNNTNTKLDKWKLFFLFSWTIIVAFLFELILTELYIEMVRRTDLIRFGKFVEEYEFMDPSTVGDVTKNLYPIPANALLSNPNLVQNPGY
jgi:hypothetical protein